MSASASALNAAICVKSTWKLCAAHRLPDKKITKCFVSGFNPDFYREEMNSRIFETLDDVIREAREQLSNYRDILKISDRIKKVEPKNEFSKPRKDFPTAVSIF